MYDDCSVNSYEFENDDMYAMTASLAAIARDE